MDEFFYEHLKNKFGIQPVIAKWGYNIVHALQIHQSESPEIQLFMVLFFFSPFDISFSSLPFNIFLSLLLSSQTLFRTFWMES